MILINAPLSRPEETAKLIRAGADELYCGVLADDWQQAFDSHHLVAPNRRDWVQANLRSFKELAEVVSIAHSLGRSVSCAFNVSFSDDQVDPVLAGIDRAVESGIDALIITDPGLMLHVSTVYPTVKIHVGTCASVYNSLAARFFQELGACRIVLPRDLALGEMGSVIRATREGKTGSIEFEAFILNTFCKFADGFCTFQHGLNERLEDPDPHRPRGEDPPVEDRRLGRLPRRLSVMKAVGLAQPYAEACFRRFDVSAWEADAAIMQERLRVFFTDRSNLDACGICTLDELARIGVDSVKIVGRANPTDVKLRDTACVRRAVDLLVNGLPHQEFAALAKEAYRELYRGPCPEMCYR